MKTKYFDSFVELYEEIEFHTEVKESGFHIFRFEDLQGARNYMSPYQRGFYQITLIQDFGKSAIEINTQKFTNVADALYFVSPNQLYSWYRDRLVKGFIIYFTADFLEWSSEKIKATFGFFDLYKANLVEVTDQDLYGFRGHCEQLLAEFHQNSGRYRKEVLHTMLLTLLYKSMELYEAKHQPEGENKHASLLLRFEKCVDNHYLQHKTVQEYAEKLNVTPNHLSQTIKKQTGKSAKRLIDERILVEARNMLKYTDLLISDIAYQLGFEELTHFGRFFRKMTGESPATYRSGLNTKK